MWGGKHQTINLLQTGLSGEFFDRVKPLITVSVWTAAREDCGSKFKLTVKLLKNAPGSISSPQMEHFQEGIERSVTPDTFILKRLVGKEEGGKWYQASHAFIDYPNGIRFIQVILQGKDTQGWAGNYGPKFAAPCVTITTPQ